MAKAKKKAVKKAWILKSEPVSALTIAKKGTEKLTPNQAAFNKLTSRIEKLRKEIVNKQAQLDEAIKIYGEAVAPLEADIVRHRRELLLLVWPYYQQKKLPKADRPYLKSFLQEMMSEVLQNSNEEPDAELKAIFKALEGEDYETVLKREEKQMREEMKEDFKSWGVDMDWDMSEPLNEEEMAKKMHQFQQQMQEKLSEDERRRNERYKTRPKTEKQLEKEKREQEEEQLKQKNMTTIYRQLAKLFHPDLEQDADRRMEKEVLMKNLTEAYESKNLHSLLMLELKWIHNENNHLESLTEEKLGIYLGILRSQVAELEQEKRMIIHHPQYRVLMDHFGFGPLIYPLRAIRDDIAVMERERSELQHDVAAMQQPGAIEVLKKQVQLWKSLQQRPKNFELEDLLDMMFGDVPRK